MSQLYDAANANSAWIEALLGVGVLGLMAGAVVGSILFYSFLIGNKERPKPKRKGSSIPLNKGNSGSTHSPRSRDDDCGSYGGYGSDGGCSSGGDSGGGSCGGGGD